METHKAAEQNWYCWLYHTAAAAARDRQREEKIHFMYQSIASDLFSTHSAAHMHMMNINCHTSLFFHHIKLISKMSFSINIYFYVIAGKRAFKAYKKGSFNALSIATKWQMFCEMMTMGKNIMNRKKKRTWHQLMVGWILWGGEGRNYHKIDIAQHILFLTLKGTSLRAFKAVRD